MVDQAKENLNIEAGAGGAAKEKTDYQKILEGKNKNTLGDQEAAESAQKAAELLKKVEEDTPKNTNVQETPTTTTGGYAKQGEQFIENNPTMQNRIPAGANIPKDLQQPQKGNVLGKAFQWISTKILGKDNL